MDPSGGLEAKQAQVDREVFAREEAVKKRAKLSREEYLLRAKKYVLEHLSEEDIQTILNNPTYRAQAVKCLSDVVTVFFENQGQDYLEWDVDKEGIVQDCRPLGANIWRGTKVNIQSLEVGKPPLVLIGQRYISHKIKILGIRITKESEKKTKHGEE